MRLHSGFRLTGQKKMHTILPLDLLSSSWYIPSMTTTIFANGRSQAVRIPKEFRFDGKLVSIRPFGDGVVLLPVKDSSWPDGFFEKIRIDDPKFSRAEQGELPPIIGFPE